MLQILDGMYYNVAAKLTQQRIAGIGSCKYRLMQYQQASNINHDLNVNKKYDHLVKINKSRTMNSGFKECYGYDCLTTKKELQLKRKQFWETRVDGRPQCWEAIKSAIQTTENSLALEILRSARVTMLNHNIQMSVDFKYHKYEIPVFLLAEPISYSKNTLSEKNLNFDYDAEILITLKIRSTMFPNQELLLKDITSGTLIKDIKDKLLASKNLQQKKVKLFYSGKILSDDKTIGNYSYNPEHVIQAMIS